MTLTFLRFFTIFEKNKAMNLVVKISEIVWDSLGVNKGEKKSISGRANSGVIKG